MKVLAAVVTLLSVAAPATSPVVTEPKTGVTFATKVGDMSWLRRLSRVYVLDPHACDPPSGQRRDTDTVGRDLDDLPARRQVP